MATIEDPFGHKWFLSTHVEDVPPDEIARRADRPAQLVAS
jgi:PhnB protein